MPRAHSILVLYNKPLEEVQTASPESDAGILQEVESIRLALTALGYSYRLVGITSLIGLRRCLYHAPEPIVMNLVEYLPADVQDASIVPSICRAFGKACTGNESLALMLGLDKWRAKALFRQAGLHIPEGVVIPLGQMIPSQGMPRGPYIVKPMTADASEGIDDKSLVQLPDDKLDAAVRRIHTQFKQAALVEQYVGQREINVSLLQVRDRVKVLPLAEIDFSSLGSRPHIVGYSAKWQTDSFEYLHTPRLLPAPLTEDVAERVRKAAKDAWAAVGCRDYARVDMRLEDGIPYIIEVNPNPGIAPGAGYVAALEADGTSYERFVEILVENAQERLRLSTPGAVEQQSPEASAGRRIRQARLHDRPFIKHMLEGSQFFREDEVEIALEVLDEALVGAENNTYESYVLEEDKQVLGWVSWGPTPCTLSTFDVYWIVVEPSHRASGLGSALLAFAEEQIRIAHGHLAVVETSGNEVYYSTRQFYLKRGYREACRLADYYAPGDDKLVYTKVIA